MAHPDATAAQIVRSSNAQSLESLKIFWCVLLTDRGGEALAAGLPRLRFLNLGKCRKISKWTLRALPKKPQHQPHQQGQPVHIAALGTQVSQEDCEEHRRVNGGFAYIDDASRLVESSWFSE